MRHVSLDPAFEEELSNYLVSTFHSLRLEHQWLLEKIVSQIKRFKSIKISIKILLIVIVAVDCLHNKDNGQEYSVFRAIMNMYFNIIIFQIILILQSDLFRETIQIFFLSGWKKTRWCLAPVCSSCSSFSPAAAQWATWRQPPASSSSCPPSPRSVRCGAGECPLCYHCQQCYHCQ